MPWNPFKKNQSTSPGSSADDFSRVAAETVSAPTPSSPEPGSQEVPEFVSIPDEYARDLVKLPFWPLAEYVDPAWELSDEEAERARPKVQKFLEWFLNRYMPMLVLRLAAQYPELVQALVAMVMLAWYKAKMVRKVVAERAAREQAVAPADVISSAEHGETLLCEICGKTFSSREFLAAHLPCRPA